MTVRATGDYDDGFDADGCLASFYKYIVIEHDVDPTLGTLTYDTRVPRLEDYKGPAPAPQPSGSSTFQPYTRGYVYDEEIEELRARGVDITILEKQVMVESTASSLR